MGLRAGVAEERVAAVVLGVLADATGRGREGGQRPEEPAVGLVLPRHRAVALPPVAAQLVEAAVVADARIGVRRDVVDVAVGQRLLGQGGPGAVARPRAR